MNDSLKCQSCTMPIESGSLCQHCGDERGELRAFDEVFPRMVQWILHNEEGIERAEAEHKTLEFMKSMPAWSEDQELRARLGQVGG